MKRLVSVIRSFRLRRLLEWLLESVECIGLRVHWMSMYWRIFFLCRFIFEAVFLLSSLILTIVEYRCKLSITGLSVLVLMIVLQWSFLHSRVDVGNYHLGREIFVFVPSHICSQAFVWDDLTWCLVRRDRSVNEWMNECVPRQLLRRNIHIHEIDQVSMRNNSYIVLISLKYC